MYTYVQGSLFEKGYLLRTLGAIAHEGNTARTAFVEGWLNLAHERR
jgi:hypothetical protein